MNTVQQYGVPILGPILRTFQVFVQATERVIPTATLSKISSIRHGTLGRFSPEGVADSGGGGVGAVEEGAESTRGGSSSGTGMRRPKR